MITQWFTSSKVRPHPLQMSSPFVVEQIAMHGVSGRWLMVVELISAVVGESLKTPGIQDQESGVRAEWRLGNQEYETPA